MSKVQSPKSKVTEKANDAGGRRCGQGLRLSGAFTLIELILVMALLTIIISVTAPSLSRFFRGRTLDSEARRLLALARSGHNRAVTEGLPMDLWVDAQHGTFGLEAEPSYDITDGKAVEFSVDSGLQLEVVSLPEPAPTMTMSRMRLSNTANPVSAPRVVLAHPTLPTIRFLPDGSIAESSPRALHIVGREGNALYLAQTSDRMDYEIRNSIE